MILFCKVISVRNLTLRVRLPTENPRPVDNKIFGGSNLGTVALIPASDSVPLSNFTFELSLALNCVGKFLNT